MNEQQLISFGNFLLSSKRTVSDILKGEVTHADLENWKGMNKPDKGQLLATECVTLRDYFANQALQSMVLMQSHNNPKTFKSAVKHLLAKMGIGVGVIHFSHSHDYDATANASYTYADAMLKARSV